MTLECSRVACSVLFSGGMRRRRRQRQRRRSRRRTARRMLGGARPGLICLTHSKQTCTLGNRSQLAAAALTHEAWHAGRHCRCRQRRLGSEACLQPERGFVQHIDVNPRSSGTAGRPPTAPAMRARLVLLACCLAAGALLLGGSLTQVRSRSSVFRLPARRPGLPPLPAPLDLSPASALPRSVCSLQRSTRPSTAHRCACHGTCSAARGSHAWPPRRRTRAAVRRATRRRRRRRRRRRGRRCATRAWWRWLTRTPPLECTWARPPSPASTTTRCWWPTWVLVGEAAPACGPCRGAPRAGSLRPAIPRPRPHHAASTAVPSGPPFLPLSVSGLLSGVGSRQAHRRVRLQGRRRLVGAARHRGAPVLVRAAGAPGCAARAGLAGVAGLGSSRRVGHAAEEGRACLPAPLPPACSRLAAHPPPANAPANATPHCTPSQPGALYLVGVDDTEGPRNSVSVARSLDGGRSWNASAVAAAPPGCTWGTGAPPGEGLWVEVVVRNVCEEDVRAGTDLCHEWNECARACAPAAAHPARPRPCRRHAGAGPRRPAAPLHGGVVRPRPAVAAELRRAAAGGAGGRRPAGPLGLVAVPGRAL